jgi:LDH2 family malate/lactate/ureidoglycolate dehydrogenase
MVEILCGLLSGGAMSVDVGGIRIQGKPTHISQTFLAVDPARFMPRDECERRIEWLVNTVKSAAPAKDYHEVLVAGDPERRAEAERRQYGIPLGEGILKCLAETAARLGIEPPLVTPDTLLKP